MDLILIATPGSGPRGAPHMNRATMDRGKVQDTCNLPELPPE